VRDDGDAGLVVHRGVVRARQSHAPEPKLGHLHGWQSAESIQSKHWASGQRESGGAAAATR
jgi:hypothetical protein